MEKTLHGVYTAYQHSLNGIFLSPPSFVCKIPIAFLRWMERCNMVYFVYTSYFDESRNEYSFYKCDGLQRNKIDTHFIMVIIL